MQAALWPVAGAANAFDLRLLHSMVHTVSVLSLTGCVLTAGGANGLKCIGDYKEVCRAVCHQVLDEDRPGG